MKRRSFLQAVAALLPAGIGWQLLPERELTATAPAMREFDYICSTITYLDAHGRVISVKRLEDAVTVNRDLTVEFEAVPGARDYEIHWGKP